MTGPLFLQLLNNDTFNFCFFLFSVAVCAAIVIIGIGVCNFIVNIPRMLTTRSKEKTEQLRIQRDILVQQVKLKQSAAPKEPRYMQHDTYEGYSGSMLQQEQ